MALSAMSKAHHGALSPSRSNSSVQSSILLKPSRALLSIKPEYAEAIFEGRKRFEFRRSIFREEVETVIVYMSSPVRQVAGEFSVQGVITDDIDALWNRTESKAGIDREKFMNYFAGREKGHAIEIGRVTRYRKPRNLEQIYGVRPPQSFLYL